MENIYLPTVSLSESDHIDCEGLIRHIRKYDSESDLSLVEKAFKVALKAHEKQFRDNGAPYIIHPLAVANILAHLRVDTTSIITGLLHDTIEDTEVTREFLEKEFGVVVADLVDGVTKLTRLELQSDRTKQAENFRKLVLAMSKDIRVLIVKLADRLHNMRTLHYVQRLDRKQRIARETMDIYAPLAERIGMDNVKTELQNIAFAVLEPEGDASIRARLNYLRGQGADIVEEVCSELKELCEHSGLKNVEITGREKSCYSIWEKMNRRQVAFEQLSDIMAFRIVVDSKEECYTALGIVHSSYPVVAGRFKDYISAPKANGYQSIHTGVNLRQPRNQRIEIQIRTREMHDIAENGVASHWVYKQLPVADKGQQKLNSEVSVVAPKLKKLRWVQDLLDILEDSAAPDEFLENTKLELYQDSVFCFTPRGELIQLPRGATPVDFAYAVHSQVGDRCVGAKVNGRLVPLREQLHNGAQVEIMTAREGNPSPSWERFVVTGKARARIRHFVSSQQKEIKVEAGRVALAKAFRQEGVDGSQKILEGVLKPLKQASVTDLYVSVGSNSLLAKDVVYTAYPELRPIKRAPRFVPGLTEKKTQSAVLNANAHHHNVIPLKGMSKGISVHFAGCCHPLPGDTVVGIVATGKGITVHRKSCSMLSNYASTPERFMSMDWDYDILGHVDAKKNFVGRVKVVGENNSELLASITNRAAQYNGSILNLKILNRHIDFIEILLDLEVKDVEHLNSLILGLQVIKGIIHVERSTS
ncbi:RelA/SpoT family protein [Commensalibacter papalotli (ex Servin-Garciduenas et al. 2014)]|uniref:GTP pyrophosphokinase rsh n=1 Tax=Commensalibacter papalotli (ex Servin-Garciduenas et al. 2014) TaxID=1208583 RepID=W7DVC4_9PROT|nr:bifunctional (p)ppGpp synthetase/guanosine-3',5'-bis(diphosphate) 3'-pyrophosphohydrolase [Commensalibacter papalotli (ex Servin-Garciduenas et al. 2014)]EUK18985.1 GTP pyrophosphokinase [Commensalibacter papalotli (ex Servin-Garciduenas et al. 2014)]